MKKLLQWLRTKHVCAYCRPQRWIGGNPLSWRISHGICAECLAREMAEVLKLKAGPRARIVLPMKVSAA